MLRHDIDLHIHSSCSDGSDPVPALLDKLRRAGIRRFALTDHDTIRGLAEMEALVPPDMTFLPGIEFSCVTGDIKCHILGYGFDREDPGFLETVREASALRYDKLAFRLTYLEEEYGIVFDREELAWLHGQSSPGRPHLAELLVRRGLAEDITDAFVRYLGNMPSPRIDAGQAIRVIREAGGIAVWAHPYGETPAEFLSNREIRARLAVLTGLGIRGLECFYSQYNDSQEAFLRELAQAQGLYISGGSDYHGTRKTNRLGVLGKGSLPESAACLTILRELGAGHGEALPEPCRRESPEARGPGERP